MQRASSLPGRWRIPVFFLAASLVVVADQLSKTWVRSNITLWQSMPETGWLRLTHICNSGAAFGQFQDQRELLIAAAFVGIALLLAYGLFAYRWFPMLDSTLSRVALGLVLGGTIGNLIDRLRLGCVTDFIDFGFWPAFNVADSSTVVGVIILIGLLILLPARAGKN